MEKSIKRTLWSFEFIKNKKTRSVVNIVCKIMLYYVISSVVSVGIRIITGMIRGEGGAPDFVTPSFVTFGAVRELLFVLAFVLLSRYLPIKNRIVKGLIFVFLFWTTDYLPQIMAMLGTLPGSGSSAPPHPRSPEDPRQHTERSFLYRHHTGYADVS